MQAPLGAQWIRIRSEGIPRLANGKPNLKSPTPRTREGKPDFSGMWLTDNPIPCNKDFLECGIELPIGKESINMGFGLPGGLPYRPEVAKMVKQRTADDAKDDPHVRCLPDTSIRWYALPHIVKMIQTLTDRDVERAERDMRQVFTDGRRVETRSRREWLPAGSGTGYVVVQSIGFRDDLWLDVNGSPLTSGEGAEKLRRPDYGHLDIEITVDDVKACRSRGPSRCIKRSSSIPNCRRGVSREREASHLAIGAGWAEGDR
jgi:hypothetical protein